MLSVRNLRRPGLITASFDLADGECIAVRGPSGSGKTLLLRAIADLDPNDGDVALDGRPRSEIPAPRWRRLVTYVPAESGWWAETVGAHFQDWPGAANLVEAFGLPAASRDMPIQRLSTGERQRFALIRALLLHPRVLLLDEPTSGLDPDGSAAVERQVAKQLDEGTGAIWVTHDAAQGKRVARRCLRVDHGFVTEATT
jgi:UDP-glucose/iron transport system ATP-binding protein